MKCPICAADASPRFSIDGYEICECPRCRHAAVDLDADESHVREVYGDSYFNGDGDGYHDYCADAELLVGRGRYYAGLLAEHGEPRTVLDVGAAAGFILEGLIDGGLQGEGVEPNERMAAVARQRDLCVHSNSFEAFQSQHQFDAITMIQVVAHFYDVQQVFHKAARLLRPGGVLMVETWDRESRVARCLGRRWAEYNPPSVLNFFSRHSLKALASQVGLAPVADARTLKRISVRHAVGLVEYKFGRLAALPLRPLPSRWSIPYPGDDLFWMLLRKEG